MRERDEFLRAHTQLSRALLVPHVDYGRKRGLIAEIDAAVRTVDDERAARAALRSPSPPTGRIDEPATAPPGSELPRP